MYCTKAFFDSGEGMRAFYGISIERRDFSRTDLNFQKPFNKNIKICHTQCSVVVLLSTPL